jgi:hypothetical protein
MNQTCLRPWEPDPSSYVKTHWVLSLLELRFFIRVLLVASHMGENLETKISVWFSLKMRTIDSQCVGGENWTENQSENWITQSEPPNTGVYIRFQYIIAILKNLRTNSEIQSQFSKNWGTCQITFYKFASSLPGLLWKPPVLWDFFGKKKTESGGSVIQNSL